MSESKIGKSQLRSFGLIVGGGFALIGLMPAVLHARSPRWWALAVSLLLVAGGLIYPNVLKPLHRGWMAIGEVLGWVNTRIILIVVYYFVIVPLGVLMRMTGNDPMKLKFERGAASYRIVRSKRAASHMQRQY